MTRARIDGFAAAQAAWDNAEEPCGPEPRVYPCIDCGEDVGEFSRFKTHGQYTVRGPARTCESCESPLCRTCCDKAAEILGYDNDLCAKCAREERDGL